MRRVHVFYSGRVQGVGFRYAVQEYAGRLKVTGWVKNLLDGRVEAVAEAEEKKLKTFLENIQKGPMAHYIKDVNMIWEKPTGEFDSFDIAFYGDEKGY